MLEATWEPGVGTTPPSPRYSTSPFACCPQAALDAGLEEAFGSESQSEEEEEVASSPGETAPSGEMPACPRLPDNFCRVQPGAMSPDELRVSFGRYLGAPMVEAEIRAGEMLYLPAGWFHEVTSYSEEGLPAKGRGGHLAFNYWMHPPDQDSFQAPYRDGFWRKRWARGKPRPPRDWGCVAAKRSALGAQ